MLDKKEIDGILEAHNKLEFDGETNCFFGKIYISKNDFYEIKVHLSSYPLKFPVVEELGERIPQNLDRHKYYNSDICCLTTEAMGQILLKTKIRTLIDFFNLMVIPYFKNNSFYEINKKYYKDEYSHGVEGIWEGYKDILGIENPFTILNIIKERLTGKKLSIRDDCYCKSGEKLKKCNKGQHDIKYRQFRFINFDILQKDADNLEKVLTK